MTFETFDQSDEEHDLTDKMTKTKYRVIFLLDPPISVPKRKPPSSQSMPFLLTGFSVDDDGCLAGFLLLKLGRTKKITLESNNLKMHCHPSIKSDCNSICNSVLRTITLELLFLFSWVRCQGSNARPAFSLKANWVDLQFTKNSWTFNYLSQKNSFTNNV